MSFFSRIGKFCCLLGCFCLFDRRAGCDRGCDCVFLMWLHFWLWHLVALHCFWCFSLIFCIVYCFFDFSIDLCWFCCFLFVFFLLLLLLFLRFLFFCFPLLLFLLLSLFFCRVLLIFFRSGICIPACPPQTLNSC